MQREVALLVVLCLCCAVMFAGTRRLTRWVRARNARSAATWYVRANRVLAQGDLSGGTAALREAAAEDRDNVVYTLALARALAGGQRTTEARRLLLRLREADPDDVEINYRLARLSADDEPTAVRYYNYALYGLVRIGSTIDRRQIREELIAYLIDHHDPGEAATELSALERELPDDAPSQLAAARLAVRAGDLRQARRYFEAAARFDPPSAEAFEGEGEAAFAMRDYAAAATNLARARSLGAANTSDHLEVARLVLADDPSAARLTTRERADRAVAGARWAVREYDACTVATGSATDGSDKTRSDLGRSVSRGAVSVSDADALARVIALVGQLNENTTRRCPAMRTPAGEAWAIIAAMREGTSGS